MSGFGYMPMKFLFFIKLFLLSSIQMIKRVAHASAKKNAFLILSDLQFRLSL
jgi:hypothetical protein